MEKEIIEKVKSYRNRLRKEMSLPSEAVSHFKRPVERPFAAKERDDVTILFGGLTATHDLLVKGVLGGLGYRAENLPTPDNVSLAVGKEYCNRGQCNPTYYTVGNLLRYLKSLRAEGVRDIEERYIFVTIGGCGPCRFGMYEAEYRKALTDAGFERFRVIIIDQSGDSGEGLRDAGLKMDRAFYVSLAKGIMIGDLMNELRHRISPYEINAGDTERAMEEALDILCSAFRERRYLFFPLRKAKKILERVKVDFSRVKPRVKMIGEFWAQTTDGDGNYRLPSWLEEEGCEVMVEPVSGWLGYLIWYWKEYMKDRLKARRGLKNKLVLLSALVKLSLVDLLFKLHYNLYRGALGFVNDPLPSQKKLAELGNDYYNKRISGGEGHLEVAKNLMAIKEKKAHLVISVKPFGCMPSTLSDGVQARVMADFKEGLFIPIETSGDGEVNVKSRVQMKLHEARERAKEEFNRVLSETGLSHSSMKDLAEKRKSAELTVLKLPSKTTTTAGNYALYLSKRG